MNEIEKQAMNLIIDGAKLMGWHLAFEEGDNPDAVVEGLIVGTPEFIDRITGDFEEDINLN